MSNEQLDYAKDDIVQNARRNNISRILVRPYQEELNDNLILDANTWICHHEPQSPNIYLGTKRLPEGVYHNVVFELSTHRPKDQLDMLSYRLLHEILHKTLDKDNIYFEQLHSVATSARKEGYSIVKLGDIDNQTEPRLQAYEDVIELICMFAWNSDYLEDYMTFLTEENYSKSRESLKLISLSKDDAEIIKQLIGKITTEQITG